MNTTHLQGTHRLFVAGTAQIENDYRLCCPEILRILFFRCVCRTKMQLSDEHAVQMCQLFYTHRLYEITYEMRVHNTDTHTHALQTFNAVIKRGRLDDAYACMHVKCAETTAFFI